ncbi:MAG: mevalonate kinase [Gammaproteobacteria bacterium]
MSMPHAGEVRAPGKLVWLGEYAVLEGAPAVVAAVDRYARASVKAGSEGWSLTASNLSASRHWPGERPDDDPLNLALCLLDVLADAELIDAHSGAHILLDSSALFLDGQKTGLGSSAAVLTALCQLVAPQLDRARAFSLIDQAHRRAQQGLGSGVDVAAALQGGVQMFQRPAPALPPIMKALTLPNDLHWCAVFTGHATSTADYLARIRLWQARATWEYGAYRDAMQATAVSGVAALVAGNASEFCAAADSYAEVLDAFGRAAGVDIVSAVHSQLRQKAKEAGVAYKTSGAGGGDMGVAFATETAALDRFRTLADALPSCQVMTLKLAPAAAHRPAAR